MSELEKKFKERILKSVVAFDDNSPEVLAHDLAEIAEKFYVGEVLEKIKFQKENSELKKQIKEYEIVNIANVCICKERDKLENENTELKKKLPITKEKIIKVLESNKHSEMIDGHKKIYPLIDERSFNKIASEILEDNK